MKGVIRPFAVLPEVLSGKEGFAGLSEWKFFVKEMLERFQRGAVLADYGIQNAVSATGGFLEANIVLKHIAKNNFLCKYPSQLTTAITNEAIFKSLVEDKLSDVLAGIISVHQNQTGRPPPSTHPSKLTALSLSEGTFHFERSWWDDLLQQETMFEKTPDNYKKLLLPLAKQGGHLEIWDPFFNPSKSNYKHWRDLLKVLARESKATLRIHTSEKALFSDIDEPFDFSSAMSPLKECFVKGSNRLEVVLRNQREIPDGFHDRFIFSRSSISVQFSWGIDCNRDHNKQTVVILSPETAKSKQTTLNSAPQTSFLKSLRI